MTLIKRLHTEHVPNNLSIVVTGGGSGGHITPALAVADELKKLAPHSTITYIGQTGDKLLQVPRQNKSIDKVQTIRAGKFRRYHGEGLKQLLDVSTMLKNIRDIFYVLIGIMQSYRLLGKIKPKVIFIKGGYVGVPVGLAAAVRKIPYVTHDSDAVPGLANRITSRWASAHAVALPKELYGYDKNKTFFTGVPVAGNFTKVSEEDQIKYKKQLGLGKDSFVVLVTGGGMGAKRLNEAIIKIAPAILSADDKLVLIHATGPSLEQESTKLYEKVLEKPLLKRVIVSGYFVNDLYMYSGAADLIISRAGATTIAELALQHKACIIVPNPQLTGGHQLKNASYLEQREAALLISDEEVTGHSDNLAALILKVRNDHKLREKLSSNLGKFAKPRAAKDLADIVLETALGNK